jgi:hypothetical protein
LITTGFSYEAYIKNAEEAIVALQLEARLWDAGNVQEPKAKR